MKNAWAAVLALVPTGLPVAQMESAAPQYVRSIDRNTTSRLRSNG